MNADRGSILKGVGISFALLFGAIILLALWSSTSRTSTGQWTYENPAILMLLLIGFIQVVWIVPAAVVLHSRKKTRTRNGVLLVAIMILLLNVLLLLPMIHSGRLYF
jgi:hypothetical protein